MVVSVPFEKDFGDSAAQSKRKASNCTRRTYTERRDGQTALKTVKKMKICILEIDGKSRKIISTAVYHVRIV